MFGFVQEGKKQSEGNTTNESEGVVESILRERLSCEEKKRIETEGQVLHLEAELEEYRELLEQLQQTNRDGVKGVLWNLLQQLRNQGSKSRGLDKALQKEKEKTRELETELETFYSVLHFGRGRQTQTPHRRSSDTGDRSVRSSSAPRIKPAKRDQSPVGAPICRNRPPGRPAADLRQNLRRSSHHRERQGSGSGFGLFPFSSGSSSPVPSPGRSSLSTPVNRRLSIEDFEKDQSYRPSHRRNSNNALLGKSSPPSPEKQPCQSPGQKEHKGPKHKPDRPDPLVTSRSRLRSSTSSLPLKGALPLSPREKVLDDYTSEEEGTTGTESDNVHGWASSFYGQGKLDFSSAVVTGTESHNITPFASYLVPPQPQNHRKAVASLGFDSDQPRAPSRARVKSSGQLNFFGKVMELQEAGQLNVQSIFHKSSPKKTEPYSYPRLPQPRKGHTPPPSTHLSPPSSRSQTPVRNSQSHRKQTPQTLTPPVSSLGGRGRSAQLGLNPEECWSHKRSQSMPSSPCNAYSKSLWTSVDTQHPGQPDGGRSRTPATQREIHEDHYRQEIKNLKDQVKSLKQAQREAEADMDKLMDELFQQAEERTKLTEQMAMLQAQLKQQAEEKEELLKELLNVRNKVFTSNRLAMDKNKTSELNASDNSGEMSECLQDSTDGIEGGLIQLSSLSVFDVCCLLKKIGLDEYTNNFRVHQIDGNALLTIDENRLTSLEVKWFHQPLLLNKLKEFNEFGGVPDDYLKPKKEECVLM